MYKAESLELLSNFAKISNTVVTVLYVHTYIKICILQNNVQWVWAISVTTRSVLDTITANTVIIKIDIEGYECKVSHCIQYILYNVYIYIYADTARYISHYMQYIYIYMLKLQSNYLTHSIQLTATLSMTLIESHLLFWGFFSINIFMLFFSWF